MDKPNNIAGLQSIQVAFLPFTAGAVVVQMGYKRGGKYQTVLDTHAPTLYTRIDLTTSYRLTDFPNRLDFSFETFEHHL